MSDETELNSPLSEGAGAIEAALRGVMLPDSAIDHDCLMYQAGWAAAMAECAQSPKEKTQTKPAARFWPALALTFAASTAACLAVMLFPPTESGVPVAKHDSAPQETVESKDDDRDHEVAKAAKAKNRLLASTTVTPRRFGLAQFFGGAVEKMMADRNAQFEKHLVEAASPSLTVFRGSGDDRDFKRPKPLTLRSLNSFSL